MKIELKKVDTLRITEVRGLDPITVMLENFEPGKGKITIECFGESWSASWGAMSGDTVQQFVCRTDDHYLAKNLSNINSSIIDVEASIKALKGIVDQQVKDQDITRSYASFLKDDIDNFETPMQWIQTFSDTAHEILGGEPWHYQFPTKINPNYSYLLRIIQTVRSALKEKQS